VLGGGAGGSGLLRLRFPTVAEGVAAACGGGTLNMTQREARSSKCAAAVPETRCLNSGLPRSCQGCFLVPLPSPLLSLTLRATPGARHRTQPTPPHPNVPPNFVHTSASNSTLCLPPQPPVTQKPFVPHPVATASTPNPHRLESATTLATGRRRYFCSAMPWVDCTPLRYHCTKVPGIDLCPQAYAEGRFPPGCSVADFARLEGGADRNAPDATAGATAWTPQETLL
jgi:hypothetical protein